MKKIIIFLVLAFTILTVSGQKSSKTGQYFDDPIVIDSLSTIVIPTRYSSDFLTSNKIAFWGDFYANIIFYDFFTYQSDFFTFNIKSCCSYWCIICHRICKFT